MRDAIVAAITLNVFNNRCDVVGMANVAQLCNNLHSLYLAGGENFVETPNYHVFAMYQQHQCAQQLETGVLTSAKEKKGYEALPMLSVSSSIKDGKLTVTLANLDIATAHEVCIDGIGRDVASKGTMTILRAQDPLTCNTFENPTAVVPETTPVQFANGDSITVPAASVVALSISLAE